MAHSTTPRPARLPPQTTRRSVTSDLSLFTSEDSIIKYNSPKAKEFLKNFRKLRCNNRLISFNKVEERWDDWHPPVIFDDNGSMTAASPAIYVNLPGYSPPLCADISNPFRTDDECSLAQMGAIRQHGRIFHVFKAPHQGFLIPEPEDKEYDDPGAHAVVHATANSHPHLRSRYLPIVPKPRPLRGPRTLTLFYSRDWAAERASPAHPWLHPAYYTNETPHILFPYSISSPSNTVNAIHQHGHFFDTELGRIVHALNSATGTPISLFMKLLRSSSTCSGCLCVFSVEGYQAHLGYVNAVPHCLNTPECPEVPEPSAIPSTSLTAAPSVSAPCSTSDYLYLAFLAWNSRLGVPQDVWTMISTAVVTCCHCLMVRTFRGDQRHQADGFCQCHKGGLGELLRQIMLDNLEKHGLALIPQKLVDEHV
ncbi:hypothetical protein GYMLUDRAFT_250932 [Collybiopsis luxurians FD-317 M1]|uniref:Uncharacterized protein n=1 Tax=Collybiopsis luxurians FD-317 M1 TaxID=944289 RepID=A0A0D0BT75_9AGAR|nr:hypothetical protein GYMLUDRAFT_250932 [Collybiopsis luxurians FD-317 M1]